MDEKLFIKQAEIFVKVAQRFPDIEAKVEDSVLKLHYFSRIEWEICAFYSFAYRSPVFYFRCRNRFLSVDEMQGYIEKFKEYVSPSEFPITGEPFFMLHPCRSQELIVYINLAGWLSTVLQTIGVAFPIKLYDECVNYME